MNTVKIGVMPGILSEYALEAGTTVGQALEVAGLNAEGFEIKADGSTVTDVNAAIGEANVILLTKKVKGNSIGINQNEGTDGMYSSNTVKIGVMPGILSEYALPQESTVADALALANLSADGFEVKADGSTVTDFNAQIGSANVILLTKKVKGNNSVKIGVMPGILSEYALEQSTTVADALQMANLSADGYEVKADGSTVTDFNQPIGSSNVILLTKKVKGN